tara:strand:+ start:203 stop:385 length:183 start_codon:yes stop_codon:yes gene_type:complete
MKEKWKKLYYKEFHLGHILAFLLILASLTFMSSCSTIEILDGLCYNDRDGTYVCMEEEEE